MRRDRRSFASFLPGFRPPTSGSSRWRINIGRSRRFRPGSAHLQMFMTYQKLGRMTSDYYLMAAFDLIGRCGEWPWCTRKTTGHGFSGR